LVTSFGYVAYDFAIIASLFYLATKIESVASVERFGSIGAFLIQHLLWIVYWFCQGSVMTGVWVLGHECGHGGFAKQEMVNNVTGWILHSALLVPFFSWQISHKKHHGNTGSLEHDEVFVPQIAGPNDPAETDMDDQALIVQCVMSVYRFARIVIMLSIGWPIYLFTNATGNKSYPKDAWVNHFMPSSPIYADIRNGPWLVILSDIGVMLALSAIFYASSIFSFASVFYYYLIPYTITNCFLVLITFLQHTDHALPHMDKRQWDWLRGALLTVDRDYGFLNHVFHRITDTHVVHHLFSYMPFYNAAEATEAVKPLLGDYYLFDDTPFTVAVWRAYGECHKVKPDQITPGIFWF
jgi:omega-6 fatty acid desaturase (delta-12 desaturase)